MTGYILKCYYISIVHRRRWEQLCESVYLYTNFILYLFRSICGSSFFLARLLMRDKLCHKLCDNHLARECSSLIGHRRLNSSIKFNLHIWGMNGRQRSIPPLWPELCRQERIESNRYRRFNKICRYCQFACRKLCSMSVVVFCSLTPASQSVPPVP